MATLTDMAMSTETGTDTEMGIVLCTPLTLTSLPATASYTDSSTMHYYQQGPTSPPTWTASRSSSRPCGATGCAVVGAATTTVRRGTSPQSTARTRTSSSSQRTRASDSSSVRYPVLMEANALAETCAGVHQTQQGSFATCQFRLLPDLLLTATRMPATRDQNLPPTPCTLSHCPISKCHSTHPW